VRERTPTLTAVRLTADKLVVLADGRDISAHAGDWLITRGQSTVDVVGDARLDARYQREEGGMRLSSTHCARLEQTTGVGATRTPEDLCTAVERLAKIAIGTIQIDFTPGQLEEISARAIKRGRTVKQELQAVVDRIREEIFWRN
jgi:hypothetical protein